MGNKAPSTGRDSIEVARSRRFHPHTGNGGLNLVFGSSQSWSETPSIQDEAMDVAQSTRQGAHVHAVTIGLLNNLQ